MPISCDICTLVTRLLSLSFNHLIFMPPTLKKWGAYWFQLVRSFVRSSIRPFVCPFVLPSVQKKIQARVLKFHIWIPRQKIAYPYFFSCLKYLPLPSYAPFKG